MIRKNTLKTNLKGKDNIMTNINLNSNELNLLTYIPFGDRFDNADDRVQFALLYLKKGLDETTKELNQIFTIDEFNIMLTIITSFSPFSLTDISTKQYLKVALVDTISYNDYPDLIENIDKDSLFKKLDQLTEFQSFCLLSLLDSSIDNDNIIKNFVINK